MSDKKVKVLVKLPYSLLQKVKHMELCPEISHEKAVQLIEKISEQTPYIKGCSLLLCADYKMFAGVENLPCFLPPTGTKSEQVLILDIYFFPVINRCMCGLNIDNKSTRGATKACIKNIKAGKCCDPIIRDTIGKILFAEKYDKQKTK